MMIQELIQHFHLQEDNVKRAQNELAPGQSLLEHLFEKNGLSHRLIYCGQKIFLHFPS